MPHLAVVLALALLQLGLGLVLLHLQAVGQRALLLEAGFRLLQLHLQLRLQLPGALLQKGQPIVENKLV